jgi:hypothetical protein
MPRPTSRPIDKSHVDIIIATAAGGAERRLRISAEAFPDGWQPRARRLTLRAIGVRLPHFDRP